MIPVLADLLPNVNELFEYKGFFGQHQWYEFNKTAAAGVRLDASSASVLFYVGSRKKAMVPAGLQNVAEMGYETVEQQIAVEVMGPENGKKWAPVPRHAVLLDLLHQHLVDGARSSTSRRRRASRSRSTSRCRPG